MNGYIYIRYHPSYDNCCKLGKTHNIPERDTHYATGELKRGYFESVYNVLSMDRVEVLLKKDFKKLNTKYDAGTEFFKREIIELIEPYFIENNIKYKKLSKQEIKDLLRINRVRDNFKKLLNTSYWKERDYQRDIIEFSKNELDVNKKIYIDLPTGGGKSYIVYNLLNYLKSNLIIIVSPRKIINSQNISKKYLQILQDKYITLNYSLNNNIKSFLKLKDNKIIICCTQSFNNLEQYITTNCTIWFDEAHWAVEDWNIDHWIFTNEFIQYKIFTSASPNPKKITEDKFGKLYSPIKIKELIELKWLAPIKAYVYSENKANINSVKYIIDDFASNNYGFSFHNKQKNAFNLFYKHYIYFKNNETIIKPFLLVSDDFNKDREPRLNEILLDYEYRNIKIYETSIYSIGYVVAKYSIGYDFNKLDFIHLSDPKLSIQDIKQCIGRGIRPNGLDSNKILTLSLPVYINEQNDYSKVIEVLQYLLHDIGMPVDKIENKTRKNYAISNIENQANNYNGIEDIKSVLLNLLGFTFDKAKKILSTKNIKSKEDYYKLCDVDNRFNKDPEGLFKHLFTNWIDYLNIKNIYYDLSTCKVKVKEYIRQNKDLSKYYLNLDLMCKELCKLDRLFPPDDLWREYYNVVDLNVIIKRIKI